MKQVKLAFVLLTIMIVLGNCTFENRTTTTKMCLEDLAYRSNCRIFETYFFSIGQIAG